jgi:hypothetical protein
LAIDRIAPLANDIEDDEAESEDDHESKEKPEKAFIKWIDYHSRIIAHKTKPPVCGQADGSAEIIGYLTVV